MSNESTRLKLYLPEGEEDINVTTDLNGNLEKIDTNINFRVAANTAARLAITPIWEGLTVRETDTAKCYVSNGSSPASGSWVQVATDGVDVVLSDVTVDSLTSTGTISGVHVPMTVHLTADSERVNTTTKTDDAVLTAELEANSVYLIEFTLILEGASAADISTDYTTPSGATGNRNVLFYGTTLAGASAPYATNINYGTDGVGTLNVAWENTVMTTTSAGTFAFKWAQLVSNATATKIKAGSWMRITKLT